ncbi:hypothetical protein D3C81_662960 [compost metagenome]
MENEQRQKIIKRVKDTLEVFMIGTEFSTDKNVRLSIKNFGISSIGWYLTWDPFRFEDYYPIEVYLYGKDDWIDVQICENVFSFVNIEEVEEFSKYEKRFSNRELTLPGFRVVTFRPKNNKQFQEILQKLIRYM